MQHPTLTLIIRYPNQTLNLASQQHLRNKVIAECSGCKRTEVLDGRTKSYGCKFCGCENGVKVSSGKNCRKQGCNGEMKAYLLPTGLMTCQCDQCGQIELLNHFG